MKPTLSHHPTSYTYHQLMVKFAHGVPLSADQLNFISRHEKALSHIGMDSLLKYYLKPLQQRSSDHHSFLMHREEMNAKTAKELRKRLNMVLRDSKHRVNFTLTPRQYLDFKNAASPSLIFYHGNQYLTGAPFHLGGIPHIILFQWGNLFGIAKYVVLPEEKALKSNVLIYFEDMQERNLNQCVDDFKRNFKQELHPSQQHVQSHQHEKQAPQHNYQMSPFKTPTLKLSVNSTTEDKK